ncbi:Phage tail tape measure protein [uncultured Caudovirales phage]|uniref:Phage tail tape measure protein n=1 Tax=uncultured Caudovirales phage TaxID=2100421 RepID=A0A6J5PV12_9CAUD|nr:Phage tail tape measure protein [uncultured Caudovirales phage]CAB4186155.1 Phage tail tape measure protein [uncultured Caudovirales phage]CAB4194252.1 Phage tail tape measure protein [uncultured Caudovirales phage]CAB4220249.1 Phage tail tape measure protein [uncultured Caudovirales phage]CAB5231078.1 Phage tail tape measure protein [uncultured Caudovirales phage]
MASKSAAISVNVIADAAKFKAGLKEAEQAAGSFDNQMKNLAKGVAAAIGTAALIRFGKESVNAAMSDAAAQVELQRQLKASTGATEAQVKSVEDYIKKTQNATGVLDDQLRPAFATLTRFTLDQTKSQQLLNIALDISTATGKPLEAVSLALGKAYGGSTTALQKLGIQTKDAAGKALSFDQIQQKLIETFGGATQEAAQTTAGKMKIAQASFADLQEEIGAALVPALTALMDVLQPIINAFNSLDPAQQQVIVSAVAMAVAMKAGSTALQALGVAAGTASLAMAPILVAFAALQAYATWEAGKDKNRNETMADYEAALYGVTTASKDNLVEQYNLAYYALKVAQANGNLTEETDLTTYAFRRLAQQSPATAKTLIDLIKADGAHTETIDKFNAILQEEITNTAELNARNAESAALINDASAALEGYSEQWLILQGLLSDTVMWDALDTSFDNLQTKAAEAFGGTEQAVKDFHIAAMQTWAEIDKIAQKLELPKEVQTQISILFDQGKFDDIWALLTAAGGGGEVKVRPGKIPGMALGGTVKRAGLSFVGENGPELLNLPVGATVSPMSATSVGGSTINITVTSADPQAVINAIRNFERRNGNGWRQ